MYPSIPRLAHKKLMKVKQTQEQPTGIYFRRCHSDQPALKVLSRRRRMHLAFTDSVFKVTKKHILSSAHKPCNIQEKSTRQFVPSRRDTKSWSVVWSLKAIIVFLAHDTMGGIFFQVKNWYSRKKRQQIICESQHRRISKSQCCKDCSETARLSNRLDIRRCFSGLN